MKTVLVKIDLVIQVPEEELEDVLIDDVRSTVHGILYSEHTWEPYAYNYVDARVAASVLMVSNKGELDLGLNGESDG